MGQRMRSHPTGYNDVKMIAETRGSRKRIRIGGKEVFLRGHGLSGMKLGLLLAEWERTGKFVSPYSRGPKSYCLLALDQLGANRAWSLAQIKVKVRELMSRVMNGSGVSDWTRFETKELRGNRPQGATARIYGNFKAFRRLCRDESGIVGGHGFNPYGRKLYQMGCCVDIFVVNALKRGKEHVEKFIRLNTHSCDPLCVRIQSHEEIEERYPVNLKHRSMGPY